MPSSLTVYKNCSQEADNFRGTIYLLVGHLEVFVKKKQLTGHENFRRQIMPYTDS